MTEMLCRECGEQFALRSRFEGQCTECGSEEIEEVDAYDPDEHELRCDYCGYSVDTRVRAAVDSGEVDADDGTPTSVDDPCPICNHALVPDGESKGVRKLPEYKLAREAANKLRRSHGIAGPPYDMEALAAKLGLEVEIGPFQHDGMLVGTTIEIPGRDEPPVQRFAIAHEIAHHVLRHQGDREKAEPEANAFASELVVPRQELKAATKTNPSLRALKSDFGVSREAMVYAVMSARLIGSVRP